MRRHWRKVPIGARWVTVAAVAVLTVTTSLLVDLPGVSPAAATTHPYELTLGDSYSIGYQPGIGGTPGYTGYLAGKLGLMPENFGCGGATTTSCSTRRGVATRPPSTPWPTRGSPRSGQPSNSSPPTRGHATGHRLDRRQRLRRLLHGPVRERGHAHDGSQRQVTGRVAREGTGQGVGHRRQDHRPHLSRRGPRPLCLSRRSTNVGQCDPGPLLHPGLRRPDQPHPEEVLPLGGPDQLRRRDVGALHGRPPGGTTPA